MARALPLSAPLFFKEILSMPITRAKIRLTGILAFCLLILSGCQWGKPTLLPLPSNAQYIKDTPTTYSLSLADPAGPERTSITLSMDDLPYYAMFNTVAALQSDISVAGSELSLREDMSRIWPELRAGVGLNYRVFEPQEYLSDMVFTSLNLSWNIFDFFSTYYRRGIVRRGVEAAELARQAQRRESCARAVSLYMDFWASWWSWDGARLALKEAEDEEADRLFEFDRGLIARAEYDKARDRLRSATSERRASEIRVDTARRQLLRFLVLPDTVRILPPDEKIAFGPIGNLDDHIDRFLRDGEAIRAAEMRVISSEMSHRMSKYSRWTNFSTYYSMTNSIHEFDWERSKASASASISYSVPIFDRGLYKRRRERLLLDYQQSLIALDEAHVELENKVRTLYFQIQDAQTVLETARESLSLARENKENLDWQFERGIASRRDFENSRTALTRAEAQERVARFQWIALRKSFDYLLGDEIPLYELEPVF
jgi:outer membrane protein TolC